MRFQRKNWFWTLALFVIYSSEKGLGASATLAPVRLIDLSCSSVLALPEPEHAFDVPRDFTPSKSYEIAKQLKSEAERISKETGLTGDLLAKALDAKEYRWMIPWMIRNLSVQSLNLKNLHFAPSTVHPEFSIEAAQNNFNTWITQTEARLHVQNALDELSLFDLIDLADRYAMCNIDDGDPGTNLFKTIENAENDHQKRIRHAWSNLPSQFPVIQVDFSNLYAINTADAVGLKTLFLPEGAKKYRYDGKSPTSGFSAWEHDWLHWILAGSDYLPLEELSWLRSVFNQPTYSTRDRQIFEAIYFALGEHEEKKSRLMEGNLFPGQTVQWSQSFKLLGNKEALLEALRDPFYDSSWAFAQTYKDMQTVLDRLRLKGNMLGAVDNPYSLTIQDLSNSAQITNYLIRQWHKKKEEEKEAETYRQHPSLRNFRMF